MFGHWTLSSCSHELKMIRGKTSWLGSGLPLFKLTSPHYTQTVTHNNTPPPNIMVTQTNAYKINICNTITQYIRMICYVSLIQRTYNINVTYMLDAETDLRYQTGHWPVLHGCSAWTMHYMGPRAICARWLELTQLCDRTDKCYINSERMLHMLLESMCFIYMLHRSTCYIYMLHQCTCYMH